MKKIRHRERQRTCIDDCATDEGEGEVQVQGLLRQSPKYGLDDSYLGLVQVSRCTDKLSGRPTYERIN